MYVVIAATLGYGDTPGFAMGFMRTVFPNFVVATEERSATFTRDVETWSSGLLIGSATAPRHVDVGRLPRGTSPAPHRSQTTLKFRRLYRQGLWREFDGDGCHVLIDVDSAWLHRRAHRRLGRDHHTPGCIGRATTQFTGRSDRILGNVDHQAMPQGCFGIELHTEQERRTGNLWTDSTL